ncbi:hypothetical protein LZ190_18100 [Rhodovulum sulfidophilum]|nr:hypothetical protein [Rhodovulum sulfidophilum]
MARTYRDRVGSLIRRHGEVARMDEAKETRRAFVDRIELAPTPESDSLTIDLHGALAAPLRLATGGEGTDAN